MATVLITGCSSGFGLLSAVELARRGHRVFATMRDPAKDAALRGSAADAGAEVEVLELDVCDDASVTRAVGDVVAAAGGIDVLVNNAGIEIRGPLHLVSDAEARAQFDTNVFGLLAVTRAAVPHLARSVDGVVVNVGSIAGIIARPFAGIYAASKHAVEAISEALHFELGLEGIRVHVIEPGQFDTDLPANTTTAAAFCPEHEPHWSVAEALESKLHGLVPGGGRADPSDVATAIADAATDPDTPLRVPVGGDTGLIMAARSGQTFEDYERTMRTFLDYWEGYRGDRP
jgi:NAD(P)-dependent dehydrogenase (short-subunit alcohol dehydrogenase family)